MKSGGGESVYADWKEEEIAKAAWNARQAEIDALKAKLQIAATVLRDVGEVLGDNGFTVYADRAFDTADQIKEN